MGKKKSIIDDDNRDKKKRGRKKRGRRRKRRRRRRDADPHLRLLVIRGPRVLCCAQPLLPPHPEKKVSSLAPLTHLSVTPQLPFNHPFPLLYPLVILKPSIHSHIPYVPKSPPFLSPHVSNNTSMTSQFSHPSPLVVHFTFLQTPRSSTLIRHSPSSQPATLHQTVIHQPNHMSRHFLIPSVNLSTFIHYQLSFL